MTHTTNKALKEWASVVQAIAQGQQITLFRKGGIIEKNHQFEVESPQFFFYPTYLHQTPEQLQAPYQPWIKETEQTKPSVNQVEINLYGRVEKVLEAKGIEHLCNMTDAFIWTPEYVEKSWAWEPEKPAYILFIRAYKLEKPHVIYEKPHYGGCISWIDLDESLTTGALTPILDAETFAQKCQAIETQLGQTVTAAVF